MTVSTDPTATNDAATNDAATNSAATEQAASDRVSPLDALRLIAGETTQLVAALDTAVAHSLADAAATIDGAQRVFVVGAGRSGLALRMTAMRFIHLGLDARIVGDATSTAIGPNDVLVAASGSGTTTSILRAAETAVEVGADLVVITTDAGSPLAKIATTVIELPAAKKQDHGGTVSAQYAGGLFESAVMLVGDALFHALWKASGQSAEQLWERHSNLE
jgi:6-phospho-3-hexuloisomerase